MFVVRVESWPHGDREAAHPIALLVGYNDDAGRRRGEPEFADYEIWELPPTLTDDELLSTLREAQLARRELGQLVTGPARVQYHERAAGILVLLARALDVLGKRARHS